MLHQIATTDPPRPSSVRPDLPDALDHILMRCLAKNREQRYSAEELARELRHLQNAAVPAVTTALVVPKIEEVILEKRLIVGRETELTHLHSLLEQSMGGSGQIAFVTGEPGMGKTSLCEKFLSRLQTNQAGVLLARGRCVEQYGSAEAYLPFLDAIGSLLMTSLREPLSNLLRTYAPTWYLQFPSVIASSGAIDKLQQEIAGATKERMLREMRDALFAMTSGSPLVLLLEDLHWADPSTIDLLRYLSARLPNLRLLILGTFREEEIERGNHPLKSSRLEMRAHQAITEIPLTLLNVEQIKNFVDQCYPSNTFSAQLSEMLYAKTEGHPLFV
ncbi:MAG TPA: AAA family ATPase, partial [Acidobacteriota bacterium]